MFLGQGRFRGTGAAGGGMDGAAASTGGVGGVNGAAAMPLGLQRFLNKKGITSQEDLANRVGNAPRVLWRRPR